MKLHIQWFRGRMTQHCGFAITAGIVAVCALLALPPAGRSASWKTKDWTQWTLPECQAILTNSPWAETYGLNPTLVDGGPGVQSIENTSAATAMISSSLVIRQASLRQLQLLEGRIPFGKLEQVQKVQQGFQKQTDACLSQNFDDRILVTIIDPHPSGFKSAPELVVSGRRYLPISQGGSVPNPCPKNAATIGTPYVFAYPRVVNGKPVLGPDDKKFTIKTPKGWERDFEFGLKSMTYKGKPDF